MTVLIRVVTPDSKANSVYDCYPDYRYGHQWQADLQNPQWVYPSGTEITLAVVFRCLICDFHIEAKTP